jgi:LPXTG-site transpeptidase (sortase) family protein
MRPASATFIAAATAAVRVVAAVAVVTGAAAGVVVGSGQAAWAGAGHRWVLRIPAIGVTTSIVPTGVNRDGTIAVPSLREARAVGWYRFGAAPGSPGPAILLGHVDTYTGPGVFYFLYRLRRGDRIYVRSGRMFTFTVTSLREVSKTDFPDGLYALSGKPMLYLITCAGTFDYATRHYEDNIIVGARLLKSSS